MENFIDSMPQASLDFWYRWLTYLTIGLPILGGLCGLAAFMVGSRISDLQAVALKRALALKLADIIKKKRITKSAIAKQMRTSRAALNRVLDPDNTSVTLATLTRAARAVGGRIKVELIAA